MHIVWSSSRCLPFPPIISPFHLLNNFLWISRCLFLNYRYSKLNRQHNSWQSTSFTFPKWKAQSFSQIFLYYHEQCDFFWGGGTGTGVCVCGTFKAWYLFDGMFCKPLKIQIPCNADGLGFTCPTPTQQQRHSLLTCPTHHLMAGRFSGNSQSSWGNPPPLHPDYSPYNQDWLASLAVDGWYTRQEENIGWG